jgi:hypothetical protein
MKVDTRAVKTWLEGVPGLIPKIEFLAWKHRRESPIIVVTTPSIGADAVDAEVKATPRALGRCQLPKGG